MNEVSLLRLYLLRGLYLLVVVGLGISVWPGVILQEQPVELQEGVVNAMLFAFWALCIVGLRYPLQMLPLLLWEMIWKGTWLIVIALPVWMDGSMDDAALEIAISCMLVILFPFAIPWRYVFKHYIQKRGERWR